MVDPARTVAELRELQELTGTRIWEPVGVAWFAQTEDGFEARSRAVLDRLGIRAEWLSPEEARRRVVPRIRSSAMHKEGKSCDVNAFRSASA